jgi:hypothetical protein
MHPVDPSIITDGSTFINPFGLAFTLLMCVLLVVLPRRYALLPIIALVCYMTMGMRIMIGSLNFTMIRILLPFGWIRLVFRGELKGIKLNPIDKTLLLYVSVAIVADTLLWQTFGAFKGNLGGAYNALGFYFMFRFLIRDVAEMVRALRIYAALIVPLAVCMLFEKMTGRDPFAVFGGVPTFTFVRDGALRCEGPFAHPILAGTFGATLMPLFVGLWWQKGSSRIYAFFGVIASIVITVTSASSGPLLAFLSGGLALCLWAVHTRMRTIRWGIVGALAALQLAMHAPIWYLIARVDVVAGSGGYHRAYLIDRAIANFSDWWLIGTTNTEAWASKDAHLFDVTNQYIGAAANGGLLLMVLFIAIIVLAFKGVGRAVRAMEGKEPKESLQMVWALGAALFTHAMTFLSVTYFDQNFVNWYFLLAVISTFTGSFLALSRRDFFASLQHQAAGEASLISPSGLAPSGAGFSPEPREGSTALPLRPNRQGQTAGIYARGDGIARPCGAEGAQARSASVAGRENVARPPGETAALRNTR